MKFTTSVDGTPRANIHLTVRMTRAALEEVRKCAAADGEDWHVWLSQQACDGIHDALLRAREDAEREAGK